VSKARKAAHGNLRWPLGRKAVMDFLEVHQTRDISLNDIAKGSGVKRRSVINAIRFLE
jgi:hypothetical protein